MSEGPSKWLTFRLAVLSAKLARRAAAHISNEHNLLLTDWRVIAVLGEGGASTVGELARQIAIDKSWISRSVDKLVVRKFARKAKGELDRRRVPYELTPAGRDIYVSGCRASTARNAAVLKVLTKAERDCLFALLTRLEVRTDELADVDEVEMLRTQQL